MANTIISSNMSLPVPVVGVDPGPDYGTDLNSCFSIIDAHDHSAGNGVKITPSGLNINADLTFQNSNSATNLKKANFTSQSGALTGTNFLSFVSGNLYVNDSSGNQIPITSGGGVAGSPGSIGSLASPAAATYTAGSKLFTWTADSGKAAAMDNGAVTIRETNVASAKGITLASPTSLAADYQLTLPAAVPASTQYLTSTSAGVLSFSTANTIAAAITRSTGSSVGVGGVAVSSASGSFSTTSSSFVDVTSLAVTITTSGRPIKIGLIPDPVQSALGASSVLISSANSATLSNAYFQILNGATVIARYALTDNGASAASLGVSVPSSCLSTTDFQSAGTYTYKVQASISAGSASVFFAQLVAYEL